MGRMPPRARLVPVDEALLRDWPPFRQSAIAGQPVWPPPLSAAPPTFAAGVAEASSLITGSALHGPASAAFRYLGVTSKVGASFPDDGYRSVGIAQQAGDVTAAGPFAVEWGTDSDDFEIQFLAAGGYWRLWADGQPATEPLGPFPSTGERFLHRVTFATRRPRRLMVEADGQVKFGGVRLPPTDSIWRVPDRRGLLLAFAGDSFVEGTGADMAFTGLAHSCAWLLGCGYPLASGAGGTGYVQDRPGGVYYPKLRDRLRLDVLSRRPDVLVFAAGANDHTLVGELGNADTVQAEALACFTLARAAVDRVYALGPWAANGPPAAADPIVVQVRDAIKAAADEAGVTFIDNIAGRWVTGDGWVSGERGNGNADLYRHGRDDAHPTQAGHDYYGPRIAAAIAATLPR